MMGKESEETVESINSAQSTSQNDSLISEYKRLIWEEDGGQRLQEFLGLHPTIVYIEHLGYTSLQIIAREYNKLDTQLLELLEKQEFHLNWLKQNYPTSTPLLQLELLTSLENEVADVDKKLNILYLSASILLEFGADPTATGFAGTQLPEKFVEKHTALYELLRNAKNALLKTRHSHLIETKSNNSESSGSSTLYLDVDTYTKRLLCEVNNKLSKLAVEQPSSGRESPGVDKRVLDFSVLSETEIPRQMLEKRSLTPDEISTVKLGPQKAFSFKHRRGHSCSSFCLPQDSGEKGITSSSSLRVSVR